MEKRNQTRGERNNNPCNIRRSTRQVWKGETKGADKSFCTFSERKYGYRAALIIIRSYMKRGLNTIEKIISTWAPSVENNTQNYIRFVSSSTGIDSRKALTFGDADALCRIVQAMARMESGLREDIELIQQAYKEV